MTTNQKLSRFYWSLIIVYISCVWGFYKVFFLIWGQLSLACKFYTIVRVVFLKHKSLPHSKSFSCFHLHAFLISHLHAHTGFPKPNCNQFPEESSSFSPLYNVIPSQTASAVLFSPLEWLSPILKIQFNDPTLTSLLGPLQILVLP